MSSPTGSSLLRQGKWDNVKYDTLVLSFGFNDAANSPWNSTKRQFTKDTYKRFIDLRDRFNPDADIILCKPYKPHSADTVRNAVFGATTVIQDIRNVIQEIYDEAHPSDTSIKIIDFNTANYSNSDNSFYSPIEVAIYTANPIPANAPVHAGPPAHPLLADVLWEAILESNVYK